MTHDEQPWWEGDKFGSMPDGWNWRYDIPAILAEHTKRIVEALEGMKTDEAYTTFFFGSGLSLMQSQRNAALDEAIEKINKL